jgi:hypothetical protein
MHSSSFKQQISGRHPDNSRANALVQNHQCLGSTTQRLGTTSARLSSQESERQMEGSLVDESQGAIIAETQAEPSLPEFQCNLSSKQPVSRRPSATLAASVSRRPSPTFTATTTAVTATTTTAVLPGVESCHSTTTAIQPNSSGNVVGLFSPPFAGNGSRRTSFDSISGVGGGPPSLFTLPLPGAQIEPPPLPFANEGGMGSATALQNVNEVVDDDHQQLVDDAVHQQLADADLGMEENNNFNDAFYSDPSIPYEWFGISPDAILVKLKLLKPEVHKPCGLTPFYKSYANFRQNSETKLLHGFANSVRKLKVFCFVLFFLS